MTQQFLTFRHPRTRTSVRVAVGPDHILVLAGLVALGVLITHVLAGERPHPGWILAIVAAHARSLRHLRTWPVWVSMLFAGASSGLTLLVSGLFLNRLIASRYLGAGWRIRHDEGDLGEYSSRFLAEQELGLSEAEVEVVEGGWRDPPTARRRSDRRGNLALVSRFD